MAQEMVLKAPGLRLLAQRIAGSRHSDVLELGSPNPANIDYLSQYQCVFHIGDLPQALVEDPGMSGPEEERDVQSAVDRVLVYKDSLRFDAIFAWNLFDYLDVPTVRAVTRRIGQHCRAGTLLHLTTTNRETIPDEPGKFTIVDEQHFRFERAGMGVRSGVKHTPRGLERIMPGFRFQHSFLLDSNVMQEFIFSHG